MKARALEQYLNEYLNAEAFHDYAPNGIQVEGRPEVRRIALGVTASQELIEKAAAIGADAVLVHHGWFWRGEDPRLVGMKGRRAAACIRAGMTLFAYHLPLDAHPEVGNNVELARRLGIEIERRAGEYDLFFCGRLASGAERADEFAARAEKVLGRTPLLIGDGSRRVERIGWCSGAAQGEIARAAEMGCDLYLSGEIRESTTYEARELGLCYLAAGHHATEQFGIQALGDHLARVFPELEFNYINVSNPA